MLQIVGKDEIAERRPYRFSDKVAEKIRKRRKEKELKRKNMAHVIVRIDTLDEIIPEDIICGSSFGNILKV